MKNSRYYISILILLLGGSFTFLFALEIYRPENYGDMNTIPCFLHIEDLDGNSAEDSIISLSYSWYYELQNKPRRHHKYFKGCFLGGTVLHLTMKKGTYRITVYTPEENQGTYSSRLPFEWKSNTFIYTVGSPALKVIFVSPTADENGLYNGGWFIDYKAPKFYIYTKPHKEL